MYKGGLDEGLDEGVAVLVQQQRELRDLLALGAPAVFVRAEDASGSRASDALPREERASLSQSSLVVSARKPLPWALREG